MRSELNIQQKSDGNVNLNINVYDTWHIKVYEATDVQTPSIEWKNYDIAIERKLLAQQLLIRWWAPFKLGQSQTIDSHKYRMSDTLLRLLTIIEKKFPKKACSELSRNDWVHIVLEYLFSSWNSEVKPIRVLKIASEMLGVGTYTKVLTVLKKWHLSYIHGEASDGPDIDLYMKDFEAAIASELMQRGTTYDEWREGGSYGSIEFVVAHLLLADAIEIINSTKTKQLIEYFESTRIVNSPSIIRAFWADHAGTLLNQYRRTGDIKNVVPTREAALYGIANDCKNGFVPVLHERLSSLVPQTETFEFPWPTYRHLISDYNEVVGAIYVIFLTIMGKRGPSEIRSLRAIDITPPNDEHGHNATFRPSISKTEKGLRQEQGVTNFIDDAFKVILQLGYKEKKGTNFPLFSAVGTLTSIGKDPTKFSPHSAGRILKDYYKKFCERINNYVDFDIKEKHKDIASHQFRHSFAEFALRRFDGYQIEEMLRMHFCHTHNHWWTKRYTSGKTDKDHEVHLSRKYIRELIPRILSESHLDNDFVGGMAVYIKKQFNHSTKSLNPTEAEEYIKSFSEEFVQITPHEYGWCMLHKKFQNVAQCADEMGLPSPTTTSSEKCNSCANFCASRLSHLSAQKKIAIAHMDFVEQEIWKMPYLKQRSREAVINAQQLFPELSALGNV